MTTSFSFITPEVVQGTTTSWLPVTTAYPSLPGCADAFFLFPGQPAPVAWDPGYGYFAGATLSCLPPQATTWWEQNHQNPDGFTSLSIQPITCPQAFTTAATEVRDGSSTLVMCCPSGYDLSGGQPGRVVGQCSSLLSSGQELTYTARATDSNDWIQETLIITTATSVGAVPMLGWNVAHAASTTGTSSTSVPSPSSSPSHGLSTGAKAGIGVGVGLSAITALCLAFLCFRRRRRSQATHVEQVQPPQAAPLEADSGIPRRSPVMSEANAGFPHGDPYTHKSTHQISRKPVELGSR